MSIKFSKTKKQICKIGRKAFEVVRADNREDKRLFYFFHYQYMKHLYTTVHGER
jgi:hypothetical protein